MKRLKSYFPHDVAGQSLRAGGATSLAEAGVPPKIIQGIGCWATGTFQIYIRKNCVLLQAMLFGCPIHQPPGCCLNQKKMYFILPIALLIFSFLVLFSPFL
jgi:hypothetical protein